MTFYGTCEKCGLPVEAPQTPAYPVRGWEVVRAAGGANSIRNRVRVPNRVRHDVCLPTADDTQEGLFANESIA